MAHIVIKDLPDSMELDRKAMVAIVGGARTRGRQQSLGRTIFRTTRIVNFPTGFAQGALTQKNSSAK
ncbi:hypothetical protein [Herbaspirillum sp. ST 5-3]|uniref:hypothetical protein n=1 Tax=Oxalobacteraceae TaxID=75682 RepID=UPI0010A4B489|nr:hypothetical protein [Herbaspirillum sp. ST 5-3]